MHLERTFALCLLGTAMVSAQPISPQPAHSQRPAPQSASRPSPADPLDINVATPRQLNALPGFGPAYTRRVIAGRPYSAKNQLVTRGVIPQGAYERIADLIVAHRVAK